MSTSGMTMSLEISNDKFASVDAENKRYYFIIYSEDLKTNQLRLKLVL